MLRRASVVLVVLIGVWLALSPASAQTGAYPLRSVRILVPAAPGGSPDVIARVLATRRPWPSRDVGWPNLL